MKRFLNKREHRQCCSDHSPVLCATACDLTVFNFKRTHDSHPQRSSLSHPAIQTLGRFPAVGPASQPSNVHPRVGCVGVKRIFLGGAGVPTQKAALIEQPEMGWQALAQAGAQRLVHPRELQSRTMPPQQLLPFQPCTLRFPYLQHRRLQQSPRPPRRPFRTPSKSPLKPLQRPQNWQQSPSALLRHTGLHHRTLWRYRERMELGTHCERYQGRFLGVPLQASCLTGSLPTPAWPRKYYLGDPLPQAAPLHGPASLTPPSQLYVPLHHIFSSSLSWSGCWRHRDTGFGGRDYRYVLCLS